MIEIPNDSTVEWLKVVNSATQNVPEGISRNDYENVNDNELQKHPCIGDRYMLLKNGIKILKIIMDKFPISKIIVTQKGLRDAITEEIILDYEKNKSS